MDAETQEFVARLMISSTARAVFAEYGASGFELADTQAAIVDAINAADLTVAAEVAAGKRDRRIRVTYPLLSRALDMARHRLGLSQHYVDIVSALLRRPDELDSTLLVAFGTVCPEMPSVLVDLMRYERLRNDLESSSSAAWDQAAAMRFTAAVTTPDGPDAVQGRLGKHVGVLHTDCELETLVRGLTGSPPSLICRTATGHYLLIRMSTAAVKLARVDAVTARTLERAVLTACPVIESPGASRRLVDSLVGAHALVSGG